ncbi:MAG TPA: hypothetical protein VFI12_10250 [Thermomicrobiales bacterium]|nr:hypothetical protein [Thermomicrobiales bacterium]
MLIDIDSGREITAIPFEHDFEVLRGRLTTREFEAMVDEIDRLIEASGGEVATAGWLPGSDWTGTPFQPIYEKAAPADFNRAAMFFGQLVWYAVMHRPERWGSGRYKVGDHDIGSRTYFRLANAGERS